MTLLPGKSALQHNPAPHMHLPPMQLIRAAAQGFAVLDIRRKHITSNW